MTVQASEVASLLRQASPNAPDAQDVASGNAVPDPMANLDRITGARDTVAGRTAASPTNAASLYQPDTKDSSFSKRFGSTLGDLLQMKGLSGGMAPFALAGVKALATQPTEKSTEGGGDWNAATSNADQTPESTTVPQPSRAASAITNIADTLGAAGAGRGPGGIVGGFTRTAAALGQLDREKMKDRQMMATSNAQMLHEQALTHKLGEDQIAAATETGKQGLNLMMSGHVPGTLVAQGKTSDQIKSMIDKQQLDPTTETVFLTGRVPVGKDANGQPIFRSTYSVVKPGGDVKFDADRNPEREFLNTYLHMDLKEGQTLPAIQVNHLWQQAQNAMASQAAVDQNLEQIGLKRDAAATRQAAKELDTKDFWINGLQSNDASTPGHPDPYRLIKTYRSLLGHGVPKDMPNFSDIFKQYVGGEKNFDILEKDYDKAQIASEKKVAGIIGMTNKEIGQDPEGAMAAADVVLNAPAGKYTAQELAEAQQTKQQAQTARDLKIGTKAKTASEEERSKNDVATDALANDGALMDKLLNFDEDPEHLAGIRGSQRIAVMNKVTEEAKRRGIDWNERDYKTRYETTQDFRPKGDSGKQVISLNVFGGHVGKALDIIPSLNNFKAEDLNKSINNFQSRLGASQYRRMRTALMAAKDEYLNFLNAGHKPSTDEMAAADTLVNEDSSPKTIHDVLQQMADTVAVRAEALNEQYKGVMKQDYPNMFTKRTADVMKRIDVDISGMGGIGGNYAPDPNANIGRPDLGNKTTNNPKKQPDLVRPADLPTAVGIKQFRNKAQVAQDYWYDISGKPLRPVAANELPKE